MASTSKGIAPDRLTGIFGSEYLNAAAHTSVSAYAFIVQEDTVIGVLTGGDASEAKNDIDYEATMNIDGITLKQGALIQAPAGELFQSITVTSGSVIAYK